MLMRLRYIGKTWNDLVDNKVYYVHVVQNDDLTISLLFENQNINYRKLFDFLRDFKILSIKKEIARARINN